MILKFVKQYMVTLVCLLLILLAVGFLFFVVSGWRTRLKRKMKNRLAQVQVANGLADRRVVLPGRRTLYQGVITHRAIQLKERIEKAMGAQMQDITRLAADRNRTNRVVVRGGREIPLLDAVPQRGLLPRHGSGVSRRYRFLADYRHLFSPNSARKQSWLTQLNAAMPPTEKQIQQRVKFQKREIRRQTPRGFSTHTRNPNRRRGSTYIKVARAMIMGAAYHHEIYAGPNSFQIRRFIAQDTPLTAKQIFEAFVDCWLQSDVVHAIGAVNHGSKNIGRAPIKRLVHITVGMNALSNKAGGSARGLGGGGPLFARENDSGAAGGPVSTGISMTGHVGNRQYDVTFMKIVVYIEPSRINDFINALYTRSNAYTVLNVTMRTSDPVNAATHGYIYGKVPVVRADILVEAVLFRRWTAKIMPKAYRTALGIAAAPGK